RPHDQTRRLVAGSHLLAITSLMEGSSNALCEALAQPSPTPVVASRIGGLVGTLGAGYPGYFPVEDTAALTRLLWRAESDPAFYAALEAGCAACAARGRACGLGGAAGGSRGAGRAARRRAGARRRGVIARPYHVVRVARRGPVGIEGREAIPLLPGCRLGAARGHPRGEASGGFLWWSGGVLGWYAATACVRAPRPALSLGFLLHQPQRLVTDKQDARGERGPVAAEALPRLGIGRPHPRLRAE